MHTFTNSIEDASGKPSYSVSDYLGQKKFFVKSAQIFAYGLQFTYLTMPCCFFHQFAFRFREYRSQNYALCTMHCVIFIQGMFL